MITEGKGCYVQRSLEQGLVHTHVRSLDSALRTEWTCSKAGTLGAHTLLQDCPLLLSILLHSVRCSPAPSKLNGMSLAPWCEIKY